MVAFGTIPILEIDVPALETVGHGPDHIVQASSNHVHSLPPIRLVPVGTRVEGSSHCALMIVWRVHSHDGVPIHVWHHHD